MLILPRTMQLEGIIAQIMAVLPDDLHKKQQGKLGFIHPPTVFMHMPRDSRIASFVATDVAVLASRNVPAAELEINPRPVTPQFLHQHSQGRITRDMATNITIALRKGKFINEEGMLLEDPRDTYA